jgi:hypothetical protein
LEPGKQKVKPYEQFRFNLTADVTNSAGETRSETSGIVAGGKALLISVEIPDKMVQTEPKSWKINVKNNEGQPVKNQVKIIVEKLESPGKPVISRKWEMPDTLIYTPGQYQQAFNGFKFGQESDFSSLKIQKKVYETTVMVDGSMDVLPTDIGKWEPGIYRIKLNGRDVLVKLCNWSDIPLSIIPKAKKFHFLSGFGTLVIRIS